MIKLNANEFPGEITNALMLRAVGLPPLRWNDKPIRAAKELLDQVEDAKLFQSYRVVDESMAATVRAMLYLWNGWPGDCEMYLQASPQQEKLYVNAFLLRQSDRVDEAKVIFQKLDTHPIYQSLCDYTLETIGLGSDPALKRFKDIVKLCESWEPFAFMDMYEQIKAGKHTQLTEEIVRSLQCREFELLLVYCFEKAVGQHLPQLTIKKTEPPRRKPKPVKKTRSRSSGMINDPAKPKDESTTSKPAPKRHPGDIRIQCPRCQHTSFLPPTRRGTKHICEKCKTGFLIPDKKPAPSLRGK